MQPQPHQQHGLAVPCSAIATGLATVSSSAGNNHISGCLMQAPSLLAPTESVSNPHLNQTMQQHMSQEQQQQQQQQQHQSTPMNNLVDPSFPVANTPPMSVSGTTLMPTFDPCVVSQAITPVSTSGLVSLFGSPAKPRTESFAYDEVKILLQEIELRKHVLLSISHSMNRFKRRAWEEVAINMANRCPYAPRRTADQVKKKWENLVSKTKQKLRSGRVTAETDWSDTNTAVLEFLAHHNPFLRMRYATAAASILSSNGAAGKRASGITTITTDFAGLTRMYDSQIHSRGLPTLNGSNAVDQQQHHPQQQQQPPPTITLIKEEVKSVSSTEMNQDDESGDPSAIGGAKTIDGNRDTNASSNRPYTPFACFNRGDGDTNTAQATRSSLLTGLPFGNTVASQLMGLPDATGGPRLTCNLGPEHTNQLVDQLTREHSMRVEILQLQKQAWQLQVELLQQSVESAKRTQS